jgi:hypothetical protein
MTTKLFRASGEQCGQRALGVEGRMDWFGWLRRRLLTWEHEWEPIVMGGEVVDQHGNVLGRSTRRTKICVHCDATYPIRYLPCKRPPHDTREG